MSAHKFHVGQIVDLAPSVLRTFTPGPYEIRRLVPATERDPDDPCYRIKNCDETHERAAPESDLTLSASVFV